MLTHPRIIRSRDLAPSCCHAIHLSRALTRLSIASISYKLFFFCLMKSNSSLDARRDPTGEEWDAFGRFSPAFYSALPVEHRNWWTIPNRKSCECLVLIKPAAQTAPEVLIASNHVCLWCTNTLWFVDMMLRMWPCDVNLTCFSLEKVIQSKAIFSRTDNGLWCTYSIVWVMKCSKERLIPGKYCIGHEILMKQAQSEQHVTVFAVIADKFIVKLLNFAQFAWLYMWTFMYPNGTVESVQLRNVQGCVS